MKKHIHLTLDASWTQVETTWRLPGSWVGRGYPEVGLFEDIARLAERGLFDLIFFGDSTGIPNTWKGSIEDAVKYGVAWPRLDMSPWIEAEHLGHFFAHERVVVDFVESEPARDIAHVMVEGTLRVRWGNSSRHQRSGGRDRFVAHHAPDFFDKVVLD